MTTQPSTLPDDALPQLHDAANEASFEGQQSYKQLTRARLWLVVGAAALGVTSWRVSTGRVDVLALVAVVFFLGALLIELQLSKTRPDKTWYEGRAVAESAKTLAWKWAVCADPFPATIGEPAATDALLDELRLVKDKYPNLELAPVLGEQITQWMKSARFSSYPERQATYTNLRVQDQQNWYRSKALKSKKAAKAWRRRLIGFEVVGVALSLVEGLTTLDLAFTPLIAAVIAASVGWIQIQQYDQLSEAYSTTVTDLAGALTKLHESTSDEAKWALEVNDAEEAMSREHTLWSAKRSQLF